MADRVYPASKPKPHPPQALNGGGPPSFPATKAQNYGATRPVYRPQPTKSRRGGRRGRCCSCCLWLTFIIVALLLLAAIAGGVFYILYRPHRPTFAVSSIRLSAFNLTASGQLTSHLDLAITARNPNRKLVLLYDPFSVSVSSDGVGIGEGSFPAFVQEAKNTAVLRVPVSAIAQSLDATAAAGLKKRSNVPVEIEVETKVGVKIGGLKTKKIRIRISCNGINVAVPKAKANATASTPDASCEAKLRVKIWKWTI